MASNILVYNYQHTCKKGQPAYILANAPFKAVAKKDGLGRIFIPFLGEGYYFWEENLNAAEYWGARNYKSDHSIIEFVDCSIDSNDILNFIDRRDLNFFVELRDIYIQKREESRKWNLGVWIEFFKKLNSKKEELFPYYYFRAKEEISLEEREKYKLKPQKIKLSSEGYEVDLDPYIMICVTDKTLLTYKDCRLVG